MIGHIVQMKIVHNVIFNVAEQDMSSGFYFPLLSLFITKCLRQSTKLSNKTHEYLTM